MNDDITGYEIARRLDTMKDAEKFLLFNRMRHASNSGRVFDEERFGGELLVMEFPQSFAKRGRDLLFIAEKLQGYGVPHQILHRKTVRDGGIFPKQMQTAAIVIKDEDFIKFVEQVGLPDEEDKGPAEWARKKVDFFRLPLEERLRINKRLPLDKTSASEITR